MRLSIMAARMVCAVFTFAPSALVFSTPVFAAGDAVKGADVFKRCAICHKIAKADGNGIGPNLFGVAGRKAASLPDFNYSAALSASGITWTDDKLLAWVSGPQKLVPGNRMAFGGITSKSDAADLVAYLESLK